MHVPEIEVSIDGRGSTGDGVEGGIDIEWPLIETVYLSVTPVHNIATTCQTRQTSATQVFKRGFVV